jgi:hypothetical protein
MELVLSDTNSTVLAGWVLVAVGALIFVIGLLVSVVVALRKEPDKGIEVAQRDAKTIPIGTVIGWIFKYGGAGAPIMVVGFIVFAIGWGIVGYKTFSWPTESS